MTLSVIIVTHNSASTISSCLRSLASEMDWRKCEIIIWDNASTDDTVSRVEESFPDILVSKSTENIGFGAAANLMAKKAQGDWILFLNPDVELPPLFIANQMAMLVSYPQRSIMGFDLCYRNGDEQPSFWNKPTLLTLLIEMYLPYSLSKAILSKRIIKEEVVDCVSGACMLVEKSVFEELGGFDERFFLYSEDFDFCVQARKAGYQVIGIPTTKVVHLVGSSFEHNLSSFFIHYYRSKVHYWKKHSKGVKAHLATLMIYSGIILRVLGYWIIGLFLKKHFLDLAQYHYKAICSLSRSGHTKTK